MLSVLAPPPTLLWVCCNFCFFFVYFLVCLFVFHVVDFFCCFVPFFCKFMYFFFCLVPEKFPLRKKVCFRGADVEPAATEFEAYCLFAAFQAELYRVCQLDFVVSSFRGVFEICEYSLVQAVCADYRVVFAADFEALLLFFCLWFFEDFFYFTLSVVEVF